MADRGGQIDPAAIELLKYIRDVRIDLTEFPAWKRQFLSQYLFTCKTADQQRDEEDREVPKPLATETSP